MVVVILINIVGFRWVSRLSGAILVFVFLPFFIVVIYGFATGGIYALPWDSVVMVPDWNTHIRQGMSTFVGTTVWAFGGFDSLGSIAGEIEGGKRTFFRGLLLCMPMMLLNYSFPLAVAFPYSPSVGEYNADGHHHRRVLSSSYAHSLSQARIPFGTMATWPRHSTMLPRGLASWQWPAQVGARAICFASPSLAPVHS